MERNKEKTINKREEGVENKQKDSQLLMGVSKGVNVTCLLSAKENDTFV